MKTEQQIQDKVNDLQKRADELQADSSFVWDDSTSDHWDVLNQRIHSLNWVLDKFPDDGLL